MEAFEVIAELRSARFQVSDGPDDDRVLGRNIQHPLVVLKPGAPFYFYGSHNAESLSNLAIPVRQCGAVENRIILLRPGYALGAPRIEEMYMCVDDRYRCGGRQLIHAPIHETKARRDAQKVSTIHFGIVSLSSLLIAGTLVSSESL